MALKYWLPLNFYVKHKFIVYAKMAPKILIHHLVIFYCLFKVYLENSYLSPSTSNGDLKLQYEKIKRSQKTFIYNTKYDSHNKVPKMGLKHKCVSFGPIMCSFGKKTITFSTDLGLRQFKSHLKSNTLNYLPSKK